MLQYLYIHFSLFPVDFVTQKSTDFSLKENVIVWDKRDSQSLFEQGTQKSYWDFSVTATVEMIISWLNVDWYKKHKKYSIV